jgi:hypothetical protein
MDGHNTLRLTSLSLLYRFVNLLYIRTLFLLLKTFWHEWSRLVTPWNDLLYIINFDLYTVSMTVFESTEHNVTFSHVIYIWPFILLQNTFCHELSRQVTLCYKLLSVFTCKTFIVQPNTISHFLTFFTSGICFYCWTRFDSSGHAFERFVTNYNIKSFLPCIPYTLFWCKLTQSHSILR